MLRKSVRVNAMNGNDKQTYLFLYVLGSIPVIWIALLLSPYLMQGGIFDHLAEMTEALNNPLKIEWMENSLKTILLFCVFMLLALGSMMPQRKTIDVAKNMVVPNGVLFRQ